MIRTMTPENMCHMTPTPPLPPHGHYPMYLKPEPMITQYPIGPATSGSGDMQQTQMLHQLLQHPQGQEWVTKMMLRAGGLCCPACTEQEECWEGVVMCTAFLTVFPFPHTAASLFTRPRRGSTPTLPTAPSIAKSSQVSSNKNQVGRHLSSLPRLLYLTCSYLPFTSYTDKDIYRTAVDFLNIFS